MKDIKELRQDIDGIDREILELFEKRMELSGDIAAYKSEKGLPVYDPVREKEKLLRISKELPEGLRDSGVALFRMLFELSKSRQAELLGERDAVMKGAPYGLLGEHLGHSYSPRIHSMLASYGYELFEKAPEEVEDFVRNGDWKGLNVTIPYKKTVIPYCTELSEKAARIGAVNTLVRTKDGGIFGDNTDAYGFGKLIGANGIEIKDKKCLVFGSGGASAMAVEVLKSLGAQDVTVISRRGENNYDNLYLHSDAELIVNTTPLGMFPKNGEQAADLRLFPKLKAVLDVVYNPDRTALLLQAEALGIKHCNGLYMLVAQAKRSSELFTGEEIPDERIGEITDALRKEALNTVLIGMPGCGKSSIAKLLSEKLSRSVI